jgi:hypothetical protein
MMDREYSAYLYNTIKQKHNFTFYLFTRYIPHPHILAQKGHPKLHL